MRQFVADAPALRGPRRLARHLHRRGPGIRDAAAFTGQGPATLTEVTAGGERPVDLPAAGPPYAAVIGHVLACLSGHADNLIEPASALPALELTLDVHQCVTQAARYVAPLLGAAAAHPKMVQIQW